MQNYFNQRLHMLCCLSPRFDASGRFEAINQLVLKTLRLVLFPDYWQSENLRENEGKALFFSERWRRDAVNEIYIHILCVSYTTYSTKAPQKIVQTTSSSVIYIPSIPGYSQLAFRNLR